MTLGIRCGGLSAALIVAFQLGWNGGRGAIRCKHAQAFVGEARAVDLCGDVIAGKRACSTATIAEVSSTDRVVWVANARRSGASV